MRKAWTAMLAVSLAVGGCSTAGPPPAGERAEPAAEATAGDPPPEPRTADDTALGVRPVATTGGRVTVTLKALDRVAPHRIVTRLLVRNEGTQDHSFGSTLAVPWNNDRLHSNSIGGLSLVDSRHGKRHFPLGYGDQSCLCTRGWPTVKAGESLELVAVFPAPPADVTHLNVLFPTAPPFLDVPLGTAPPERLTVDDSGNDPVDPLSERTTEPLILSLVDQVDDAAKARDDDGEKLTVRLSTDVLFEVNEAKLTGRAQETLRQVAADIDRSAGDTVTIEGHADDTGTHAINDPLSERRARSVQAALRRLVTRSGLEYEVRGHGSRRPIADNGTPEGRRVNRRVSVAFARPRPAATESPAPAPSPASRKATADLPVIATAPVGSPPSHIGPDYWPRRAEVRVNELTRGRNGHVALTWTVRNDDDRPLDIWSSSHDHSGLYEPSSTGGAVLVAGERRHRVLRDSAARVTLGPHLHSLGWDEYRLEKGEQYTVWAMFKLPPELTGVTVQIPGFEPVPDVPIS